MSTRAKTRTPFVFGLLAVAAGIWSQAPLLAGESNRVAQAPVKTAAATPSTGETVFSETPPVVVWQKPGEKPTALILCIHGLGLHKLTYADFAKEMGKRNIVCLGIDLRGFGVRQNPTKLDFPGSLTDIDETIKKIRQDYPGVPLFLLGESMGGAVGLHAAAANQSDVSGLISSVPSAERFNDSSRNLQVALHALHSGFNAPMDVTNTVIRKSTTKFSLQDTWEHDPLGRKTFSAKDLIAFQGFMETNFKAAKSIKNMPILVVQGAKDKLVRPTGTWDVYDHLVTPKSQIVFSKTGEHLIFEYGQFNQDDINFLTKWINTQIDEKNKGVSSVASTSSAESGKLSVNYWIELNRDGKHYRCNNKTSFKSGDEIRFHSTSNEDGYAYIVLESGSSGSRAVLFPDQTTGRNNYIIKDKDIALPTRTWLRFDNNAGTEKLRFIFSRSPLDDELQKHPERVNVTAFVSPDRSGAKDLVPTRMQISWDDADPVILSEPQTGLASAQPSGIFSSTVRVSQSNSDQILSLDIALEHQ